MYLDVLSQIVGIKNQLDLYLTNSKKTPVTSL